MEKKIPSDRPWGREAIPLLYRASTSNHGDLFVKASWLRTKIQQWLKENDNCIESLSIRAGVSPRLLENINKGYTRPIPFLTADRIITNLGFVPYFPDECWERKKNGEIKTGKGIYYERYVGEEEEEVFLAHGSHTMSVERLCPCKECIKGRKKYSSRKYRGHKKRRELALKEKERMENSL